MYYAGEYANANGNKNTSYEEYEWESMRDSMKQHKCGCISKLVLNKY